MILDRYAKRVRDIIEFHGCALSRFVTKSRFNARPQRSTMFCSINQSNGTETTNLVQLIKTNETKDIQTNTEKRSGYTLRLAVMF